MSIVASPAVPGSRLLPLVPLTEPSQPAHKRCPTCQTWQPLDAFGLRASAPDGRSTVCRACLAAQARANYAAQHDRYLARIRARRDGAPLVRSQREVRRQRRQAAASALRLRLVLVLECFQCGAYSEEATAGVGPYICWRDHTPLQALLQRPSTRDHRWSSQHDPADSGSRQELNWAYYARQAAADFARHQEADHAA